MLIDSFAIGDGVSSSGARLSMGVLDVGIKQMKGSTSYQALLIKSKLPLDL